MGPLKTCRRRCREPVALQVIVTAALSTAEGNDNYHGQVSGRARVTNDKYPAQR